MKRKTLTDLLWQILLAVFVIVSDRAVKVYIIANCRQGEVFGELPGVADFLYVRNTGAAFSLFDNSSAFMTIISILTFVVLGFFAYAYIKLLKLERIYGLRIILISAIQHIWKVLMDLSIRIIIIVQKDGDYQKIAIGKI